MGLNCIRIDLRICWVLDRLAPYKLPRALDSLLLYQQPSSTTLYYSYLGIPTLIEIRLRNETGEITGVPKGTCCPSSALSFPEDCARLKLSSARASQAGLKEMMMQTKSERLQPSSLPPSVPLSSARSPRGSCCRRRSCRGAYCGCLYDSHHNPRPGSGHRSLQSWSNYRLHPESL